MMLSYHELEETRRRKIWESLFKKWNVNLDEQYYNVLKTYNLNGREIRNYMKIVFAIHNKEKKKITGESIIETLDSCFKITDEFNFSMKTPHNLYN